MSTGLFKGFPEKRVVPIARHWQTADVNKIVRGCIDADHAPDSAPQKD
jgi:hypothetical protein